MLDISFWEISVIAIVALLIIGPDKLPKVARTIGRWAGRARSLWAKVKEEAVDTVDDVSPKEDAKQDPKQDKHKD